MPKRKVAIVNVFFPPNAIGGATRVVADNIEALQRNHADEIEVVVFTSNPDHQKEYEVDLYNYNGIRVYSLAMPMTKNFEWNPRNEKILPFFSSFLNFEKPDIVHFHCIQRLTGSIVEATLNAGIPYLITLHDAWWISDFQFLVDQFGGVYTNGHEDPFFTAVLPDGIEAQASIDRKMSLKKYLNQAKALFAVSETFADVYRKNGFPSTKVNKNGISKMVDWSPKNTAHTEKVILGHFGGMAEHKGYYLFKKAISLYRGEKFKVVVADHSKPSDYLMNTCWGQTEVSIVGRQDQDKMIALYQSIDVLFAPSTWPESFGLVTREAAACGCWVVASSIGGIAEDVVEGKNGFRVVPSSLEALQKAILEISKHPLKYKGMSTKVALRQVDEQVSELVQHYLV